MKINCAHTKMVELHKLVPHPKNPNKHPRDQIEMLGIKDFEVEVSDKLPPGCDEDHVPEVSHPITRQGDVWLLGNHRQGRYT